MEPAEFPEAERWGNWEDNTDWQQWVFSKAALMTSMPPAAPDSSQRLEWMRQLGRRPTLDEVRNVAKMRGWGVTKSLDQFGAEADELGFPRRGRGQRLAKRGQ
jgi:hypothetical protein